MSLSDPFFIAKLISKSLLKELETEDQALLTQWLEENPENRKIFDKYNNEELLKVDLQYLESVNVDQGWKEFVQKINVQQLKESAAAPRSSFYYILGAYKRWSIAAVLILTGMFALLLFNYNSRSEKVNQLSANIKNDVLPGSKVAQLVLSDGSLIDLKDHAIGFTEQDGTLINTFAGNLDYSKSAKRSTGAERLFNVLRVPKGGNYQITLSDGTNVMLNSESELRFPVHFSGTNRKVYLKGEGYFDVSKDKNRPFSVMANASTIKVLGTQFNVNLYTETVKTTLVEGKVKLQHGRMTKNLRPGELGSVNASHISIAKADLRKTLAWKNKEFYFKGDRFEDVLSQLALWYDLSVKLDPQLAELKISGSIGKDVKLSEVLRMLKLVANCHFELDNKLLTVTKPKLYEIK